MSCWIMYGTWNSKIHDSQFGRFELSKHDDYEDKLELYLVYTNNSSSRRLLVDIVHFTESSIIFRSQCVDTSQIVFGEINKSKTPYIWTGLLNFINPSDDVGLAGVINGNH